MTESMGQSISVSGGTSRRIGGSSCGENNGLTKDLFCGVIVIPYKDACNLFITHYYFFDTGMSGYFDTLLPAPCDMCFSDVPRATACREYTTTSLNTQWNADLFEKVHGGFTVKLLPCISDEIGTTADFG